MRKLIIGAVLFVFLAACSNRARNKAVSYYNQHREAFTKSQQRNGFTLQFDFIPSVALSVSSDTATRSGPGEVYHFRLQVECPAGNDLTRKDKTQLFYGLDSLFSLGAGNKAVLPIAVEPIPTGSSTRFEYLVTIARKDLIPGEQLEIIYHDRLFTNTTMSFVFDRIKIDELEKTYS